MKRIVGLAEAPAVLEAYWPSRQTLHRMSLDYMHELMDYLGNPQDTLRIVHVAGTSGKTSTAYYAAALLHAAGKKVGLAVSPHVDYLNERVQVDMEPLPEATYVAEMNAFMALIGQSDLQPTYFELLYAFAIWEFARQQVDYAVVEVGIGGLLDATNVVRRADKVCVLTDIGYDHMSILGDTLAEIAAQKAGIIQLHNVVFCWRQQAAVLDIFRKAAQQRQADLHVLDVPRLGAEYMFLPLFQRRNFELALAAVEYTLHRDSHAALTPEQMLAAAHTVIPARMEVVHYRDKTVIIDGSHNPQKLHALVESVRERFPNEPIAVLVAYAKSKTPENRIDSGTHELLQLASHLIITTFTINRNVPHTSVEPQAIADVCQVEGFTEYTVLSDTDAAFDALMQRPERVVLVAGSFYLLNAIRPRLGLVDGRLPADK